MVLIPVIDHSHFRPFPLTTYVSRLHQSPVLFRANPAEIVPDQASSKVSGGTYQVPDSIDLFSVQHKQERQTRGVLRRPPQPPGADRSLLSRPRA
jgi:hypothetical protein